MVPQVRLTSITGLVLLHTERCTIVLLGITYLSVSQQEQVPDCHQIEQMVECKWHLQERDKERDKEAKSQQLSNLTGGNA
jgi:hypothetical protein